MRLNKHGSYIFIGFGNIEVYRKNSIFLNGYCNTNKDARLMWPIGYCINWGDTQFNIN